MIAFGDPNLIKNKGHKNIFRSEGLKNIHLIKLSKFDLIFANILFKPLKTLVSSFDEDGLDDQIVYVV